MFGSLWWAVVVEGLGGRHRGVQASLDMDAMFNSAAAGASALLCLSLSAKVTFTFLSLASCHLILKLGSTHFFPFGFVCVCVW